MHKPLVQAFSRFPKSTSSSRVVRPLLAFTCPKCIPMFFFPSVAEQFKSSWRHPNKKSPEVKHVYKIISTKASVDQYEAYRWVISWSLWSIHYNSYSITHTAMPLKGGVILRNTGDRQGTRTDVGMEPDESVRLERKAVPSSADRAVARYAILSRPHLIWPSSGRRRIGEGMTSISTFYILRWQLTCRCVRFGAGIYTSSTSSK